MYIDAHVHLRDFNQKHKETIQHGLEVARDSGIDGIFNMPNTNPPIMTRNLVVDRLKIASDANVPEVFYGLYVGLTVNAYGKCSSLIFQLTLMPIGQHISCQSKSII